MFRNPLTDGIVVLIVLLLFFGPKRLPLLGRSIGEGMKEFKDGITGKSSVDEEADQAQLPAAAQSAPAAAPAQPAGEPVPADDQAPADSAVGHEHS